jgi:tetratricopeptide (TPR) repeat protein
MMIAPTLSPAIGRRYLLHETLGSGGMGTVYRATDRLAGQMVALKRVTASASDLVFSSRTTDADLDVVLAQEFKVLASLRHPRIVSVLDYGFDQERQPFFTMNLLEGAQPITRASDRQDLDIKIDYLLQTLQALAYLHRRGILHRDMKPGNVVVVDGQVKVLDFGLSVVNTRSVSNVVATTAGTFAYMAPEAFQDAPASMSADLYAVGIMAYELLAGQHPFSVSNVARLVHDILNKQPDIESLGVSQALGAVIKRLLEKNPEERYSDANEVIRDLCRATNRPLPPETSEIRESFLQAAKFVGRKAELAQLSRVMKEALQGRGSAWLIGGESGVGKSRLLDELRTLALVEGMSVVRDLAVSEGGNTYQMWRNVLRWLVLTAELDDAEAAVLKPLVPDIDALLQREVPDAPALDPQAMRTRLFNVVVNLFRRQSQPAMLVLEDLHWADGNSLALLNQLNDITSGLSLLIVANYRDDERPDLPQQLPGTNFLKLERLDAQGIAELSASMLDAAGRRQHVIELLQHETEGNPFFLVEVVRALAEEAGHLDQVGQATLPPNIFTGGVQQLVRRRLNRVPGMYQPLLRLAAVAGRMLDLDLLRVIKQNDPTTRLFEADFDLESWLQACANAAVLEIQEDRWRFAHDKLREGLLSSLSPHVRRDLHHQVALSIEQVYPDSIHHAARLAYHWSMAGDASKEVRYAELAGELAMRVGANSEAKTFFEQALAALSRLPRSDDRQRHYIDISLKLSRVGAFLPSENIVDALQRALEAATALQDEARQARVLGSIGTHRYVRGKLDEAIGYFSRCMTLAEKLGLEELLVLPYNIIGRVSYMSGDYPKAAELLERGIPLAERFNDLELLSGSYSFYGCALWMQGRWAEGQKFAERSIALAEQIGHPSRIAANQMLTGISYAIYGRFEQAQDYLHRALRTLESRQDIQTLSITHGYLGYVYFHLNDIDKAREHLDRALLIAEQSRTLAGVPTLQAYRAEVDLAYDDWQAALGRLEIVLPIAHQTRQQTSIGEIERVLAKVYMQMPQTDARQAEQSLKQSVATLRQGNGLPYVAKSLFELGKLYHELGLADQARETIASARKMFEELGMRWYLQQVDAVFAGS